MWKPGNERHKAMAISPLFPIPVSFAFTETSRKLSPNKNIKKLKYGLSQNKFLSHMDKFSRSWNSLYIEGTKAK
jgi:hypothetical protein